LTGPFLLIGLLFLLAFTVFVGRFRSTAGTV
jgi:hypothetical protein